MISSSNFEAIARLVVLARKDPGTTSPFSSLVDPLSQLTCTMFSLRAFLRKAIPLNSVTPDILTSKKILNPGLISVLRTESVGYIL